MNLKFASLAAMCAGAVLLAAPTQSADQEHEQSTSKHSDMHGGKESAGSKALHDSMSKGMERMHGMKMTGETDKDFAMMMIQHHEQAIAMSKAELQHGADAEVQKKAREIIAASEKDIADLKKWQKQKQ